MKQSAIVAAITVLIMSCSACAGKIVQRSPRPWFGFSAVPFKKADEESFEYRLDLAFLTQDREERYKEVEALLQEGANPNKYDGDDWAETNPLWSWCDDYDFAKLLIDYGADTKGRPYLAWVIDSFVIAEKYPRNEWVQYYKSHPSYTPNTERSMYECVELLLSAGADPNMKGSGEDVILLIPANWNYLRYYRKHGDLPINFCIKENLLSIVPLLVQYGAKLDKKSLELAKETTARTGSSEMEELVLAQWAVQNQ